MNLFKQYVLNSIIFVFVAVIVFLSATQIYFYNLYEQFLFKLEGYAK